MIPQPQRNAEVKRKSLALTTAVFLLRFRCQANEANYGLRALLDVNSMEVVWVSSGTERCLKPTKVEMLEKSLSKALQASGFRTCTHSTPLSLATSSVQQIRPNSSTNCEQSPHPIEAPLGKAQRAASSSGRTRQLARLPPWSEAQDSLSPPNGLLPLVLFSSDFLSKS